MAQSIKTHTEWTVEIEVSLVGDYLPFVPATPPSYASGGDPPDGDIVEDIDIDGMRIERVERKWDATAQCFRNELRHFNLLEGVDTKDQNVARLLANLIEAIGDDAQDALRAEAMQ